MHRSRSGRMRVLLVAPTALDAKGQPIKTRRIHLPSLTMPMLAAVTPPDIELVAVSETADRVPWDEHWDLVGVSGMGSGIIRGWQIAESFRQRGIRVIQGGIAASLAEPKICLEHVDSVVVGEAEEIWPTILSDVAAGRLRRTYHAPRQPPIDSLPTPKYDILNRRILGLWRPVQATRGCPFPCEFCSVQTFYKRGYRKAPVEQVLRDVRAAKAHGSRYIAFIDDNIGVDFDYCARLFEALIPEKIIWMSQCSLHIANHPEILDLAYRSGCRLLSFGVESVNADSLDSVQKSWNPSGQYTEAFDSIRRHGIEVSTEMMVGMDGDDEHVFDRTFEFIMDNRIAVPRVHILTPIPGTPLWDRMMTDGRIRTEDFGRFSGGTVVFQPNNMNADDLQAGYWSLYERLFTLRSIFHRIRTGVRPGAFMSAFIVGVNFHYRNHIGRRICPGIV